MSIKVPIALCICVNAYVQIYKLISKTKNNQDNLEEKKEVQRT